MDPTRDATEFFAPFAHIPGRFEWCRIRSPTHGVFDTFIVLGASTEVPCDVYVNSDAGVAFMAQRYPESRCHRVEGGALELQEDAGGLTVVGRLAASTGPVHAATMQFTAAPGIPREQAYGGGVWGGRYRCQGVDLELDADVRGAVRGPELDEDIACRGIVTVGSYGTLTRS